MSDPEDGQGKDYALGVAIQEGVVVELLPARAFDGKEVGAGPGSPLEELEHAREARGAAHARGPVEVAGVVGSEANLAFDAALGAVVLADAVHDLDQLDAERGLEGHLEEGLEFEDHRLEAEVDRAVQSVGHDAPVVLAYFRKGRVVDGHHGKGEIELGVDGPAAYDDSVARGHGMGRSTEDQVFGSGDRERRIFHGSSSDGSAVLRDRA
jgi:hypothetical protein